MGILVVMMLLLVAALGTLPVWPYSRRWGFYSTGACSGIVLVIAGMILWGNP